MIRMLSKRLTTLRNALVCLARTQWWRLLLEPSTALKRELGDSSYALLRHARDVDKFLYDHWQLPPRKVVWPSEVAVSLCRSVSHLNSAIQVADVIRQDIATIQSNLLVEVAEFPFLPDVSPLFGPLRELAFLNEKSPCGSSTTFDYVSSPQARFATVEQVVRGPEKTAIDARYRSDYSQFEKESPQLCPDMLESVAYLWTLSLREVSAAEMCALSGIEYDNFPLRFYLDFGKQVSDEVRHAEMFYRLAIERIPSAIQKSATSHRFYSAARDYVEKSRPLPVPTELGMYQTMWNADIRERLVLLNIDTEGLAVKNYSALSKSPEVVDDNELGMAFEVDYFDERSHCANGWRWLKYLAPNRMQMRRTLADTRLLRGFFMLTSFREAAGGEIIELAKAVAGKERLPAAFS